MTYKLKVALVATVLFFSAIGQGLAKTDQSEAFVQEQLRNPFWPVGYFPDDWQTGNSDGNKPSATAGLDWDAPTALIRVTGTSRMGGKAIAIINGEMEEEGDLVQVSYSGRIYQWRLREVKANGKVLLERVGVSNKTIGFKSGDKK